MSISKGIWYDRVPSTRHFEKLFEYAHLPNNLQDISAPFASLALLMLHSLEDGPELTTCLRKLLESKDCAVRQALIDQRNQQ